MDVFIAFVIDNVQWIFSGVGVAVFGFVFHYISKKRKKNIPPEDTSIDNSVFISEYPPDRRLIKKGDTITKSWTIQNDGKTIWRDRYLKCIYCVPNEFYPQKNIVKNAYCSTGRTIGTNS